MIETKMDEEELLRRYHADSQFSFGGLDKVKDSVNIKTNVLKDVLSFSCSLKFHLRFLIFLFVVDRYSTMTATKIFMILSRKATF